MGRFTGIRWKLIGAVALPTLAVYMGALGVMFTRLAESNRAQIERQMRERAINYADRFDGAFERAAAVARTTASLMENAPGLTEEQIFAQLRSNVLQDDAIYGAAMAFEPGTFRDGDELVCPYVYRGRDGPERMNIGRDVYDWHGDAKWQWWHAPKSTGAPAWTDPYFDKGAGNVLMVTYGVPFRRDGVFRGVTTIDIQVSRIRGRLGREILGDVEFVIVTRKGEFVYSSREADIMSGRTVFGVMDAAGRPDVGAAFGAVAAGESGVAHIGAWEGGAPAGWERWGEKSWLFFAPVKSTGWGFAAVVPESLAMQAVRERVTVAAVVMGVTLAVIIGCIFVAGRLLVIPIERLGHAVRRIAGGDLDHRIAVTGRDELGRLAHDVNRMAAALKGHTEQMARTRSESREAMIFALAKLAESRDDDTGKHLDRICRYTEVLARAVAANHRELDAEWVRTISVTAALHDIGKVGIPDAILKKPGKLTDLERKRMQSHTTIGGDTLIAVREEWTEDDFLRIAAEIALSHHEWWDGTGYPFGLVGEDISLSARIVAVADVYDALTSKRVYKEAMPHAEAMRIIVEGAGKHFDPQVVGALRTIEESFRRIAEEGR